MGSGAGSACAACGGRRRGSARTPQSTPRRYAAADRVAVTSRWPTRATCRRRRRTPVAASSRSRRTGPATPSCFSSDDPIDLFDCGSFSARGGAVAAPTCWTTLFTAPVPPGSRGRITWAICGNAWQTVEEVQRVSGNPDAGLITGGSTLDNAPPARSWGASAAGTHRAPDRRP